MTFLSLTQACRQLGIDAKTLHRWLAQAHLCLQAHPRDARLKGLSGEHLRLLASAHHRSLALLPEEGPAPAPPQPPQPSAVPEDLLALLATLSELPAQLAALQQQLTTLTQLLQPPAVTSCLGPVLADEPAVTPVLARSRPMAAPPPKPAHVVARVESVRDGHYVVICPEHGLLPLEPESPAWFAWLATRCSFRFVGQQGHFTAHRECDRLPNAVWRAHRKVRNHTYNLRLAHTPALTLSVLEQAAATLQAHLK